MGILTWLKDQPFWLVAFVALASFALISFIWAQVIIARRDSGRGSETKAPANKLPKMRATEMAADEVNRAVQLADHSPVTPMADVFALPFKHMLEQTAAQLEAQHAKKLGEIRNEKPAPQRDVILPEALAYAEFREWGRTFFEAASSAQNHANEQLEKFRQLAHDGALAVWGTLPWSNGFLMN